MEDILQGKFFPHANEDYDYPDISMIQKTGIMPKPKSTIAADSVLKARRQAAEAVSFYHQIIIEI